MSLKHDLAHLLTIGLGVEGSFCKKHRVLLRGNMELVVEGIIPDLLSQKGLVNANSQLLFH